MNDRKRSIANRRKKDVLSMEERELRVAAALDGRLKNADNLTIDQLRERVLKWMFSKNLSMKHEFVFEEMEGDLYILMGKTCKCCEDAPAADRVRYTSVSSSSGLDGDVNIEAFPPIKSNSPSIPTVFVPKSMMRTSGRNQRVQPTIMEQPTAQEKANYSSSPAKKNGASPEKNGKKKTQDEEDEEKSKCCCCQLYRECVLGFMNMC